MNLLSDVRIATRLTHVKRVLSTNIAFRGGDSSQPQCCTNPVAMLTSRSSSTLEGRRSRIESAAVHCRGNFIHSRLSTLMNEVEAALNHGMQATGRTIHEHPGNLRCQSTDNISDIS